MHSKDSDPCDGILLKMHRSGIYFNIESPDPDDIHVVDIAWGLAHTNRFLGQTPEPYSVAEHCIGVSNLLKRQGFNVRTQLAGLVHDAAETYVGDMLGTLKPHMAEYKKYEDRVEFAVYERFGISGYVNDPVVKQADMALFNMECTLVRDNPCRAAVDPKRVANRYRIMLDDLCWMAKEQVDEGLL